MPAQPSIDRVTATEPAVDPDLALVRRAQAGDVEAFGELVERNRRAVFRAALAALGSATEADDVAQEAFVTAFQKLKGFRGEASFKTWLLSITWRKAHRPAEERDPVDAAAGHAERRRHGRRTGPDRGARVGRAVAGRRAVDVGPAAAAPAAHCGLPKKLRDALLLAGSGDYSYEEIGHLLKIPVGTVKWRVSEARKVLKRKMTAMGYDDVGD